MRAREFLNEHRFIRKPLTEALAMRDYAHPEEYMIKDGVRRAVDLLQDFKEDLAKPETLNVKWDGKAAIYWGRTPDGAFYMVPNNQWNKGQQLDKSGLAAEIMRTGRKLPNQSDEAFAQIRQQMAQTYGAQWDMLEKSSPQKGFFWGDIMFDSPPPQNAQGLYEFTPNKVTYYVDPDKEIGRAIQGGARLFIAVHGIVQDFGVDPTSQLQPVSQSMLDSMNKSNPSVYLLSERPAAQPIGDDTGFIDKATAWLDANQSVIDQFMSYTAPKFTGFKTILRDYVNNLVKTGQADFAEFLQGSKLSDSQKKLAYDYVLANSGKFQVFLRAIMLIVDTKNQVLEKLQQMHGQSMSDRLGISASVGGRAGGEGYAKIGRSGEGIKYVNPAFRQAPVNPRFGGEG